jgi:hypothetical protein
MAFENGTAAFSRLKGGPAMNAQMRSFNAEAQL